MMPGTRYASDIDQAWLRLWCGLHAGSLLEKYLDGPLQLPAMPDPSRQARPEIPSSGAAVGEARVSATPLAEKRSRRPAAPQMDLRPKARRSEDRRAQRADREAKRVVDDAGLAEWARRLIGDGRIRNVTLDDVIDGVGDYFRIFAQLRNVAPPAYQYFSRVGAPLVFRSTAIYESQMGVERIPSPQSLPSYFGAFFPRTREECRDEIINDKPTFLEFIYFEKLKTHATWAPPGTTVYTQNTISLNRDAFSKEEQKKYPCTRGNWGCLWYLGILPDGAVKALPCQMSHHQALPNGGKIHTSRFEIPRGLYDGTKDADHPHNRVRQEFNAILAFTTSALAGLQVLIKRDRLSARFGIPIAAAKAFFADREVEGERRRPIIHLRMPHERHREDGKVIRVGEHLAGQRQFQWRGYDLTLGIPGIHFAEPEALSAELLDATEGDILAEEGYPKTLSTKAVGKMMQRHMRDPRRVSFRRGQPTAQFQQTGVAEST